VPDVTALPERLRLGFLCRGVAGEITVRYGVNRDGARWGFPLLGSAAVPETDGFPVCEATVVHPAEGYGSYLGWMQILDVADAATGNRESVLDLPPMYGGAVTPFICFGPQPRFFDAPAVGSDEPTMLDWTATTYLCGVGDVLMTAAVAPLAAFAWGFRYESGRDVQVHDVRPADPAVWTEHRAFLAGTLPRWGFAKEPPAHELIG
jgi:hypothetical protein